MNDVRGKPMKVGELKEAIKDLDDHLPVVVQASIGWQGSVTSCVAETESYWKTPTVLVIIADTIPTAHC